MDIISPLPEKPIQPVAETSSDTACTICSETLHAVRSDGTTEIPYKLPCSHVFGSICIIRWLEDSPQQDCPHCRRRMVHSGCGHLIMPHDAPTAPPSIPEVETQARCVRCRGEGVVAKALRAEHERLQAQEAALRGMKIHLPKFFGFAAARTASSVDDRIAALRRSFSVFHDTAWREFEENERRQRW